MVFMVQLFFMKISLAISGAAFLLLPPVKLMLITLILCEKLHIKLLSIRIEILKRYCDFKKISARPYLNGFISNESRGEENH